MAELPGWCRCVCTCASFPISKPRLIRQALNSSAPSAPEWSWVSEPLAGSEVSSVDMQHTHWGGGGMSCRHVEGWKRVHAEEKNEKTKEEKVHKR